MERGKHRRLHPKTCPPIPSSNAALSEHGAAVTGVRGEQDLRAERGVKAQSEELEGVAQNACRGAVLPRDVTTGRGSKAVLPLTVASQNGGKVITAR